MFVWMVIIFELAALIYMLPLPWLSQTIYFIFFMLYTCYSLILSYEIYIISLYISVLIVPQPIGPVIQLLKLSFYTMHGNVIYLNWDYIQTFESKWVNSGYI